MTAPTIYYINTFDLTNPKFFFIIWTVRSVGEGDLYKIRIYKMVEKVYDSANVFKKDEEINLNKFGEKRTIVNVNHALVESIFSSKWRS